MSFLVASSGVVSTDIQRPGQPGVSYARRTDKEIGHGQFKAPSDTNCERSEAVSCAGQPTGASPGWRTTSAGARRYNRSAGPTWASAAATRRTARCRARCSSSPWSRFLLVTPIRAQEMVTVSSRADALSHYLFILCITDKGGLTTRSNRGRFLGTDDGRAGRARGRCVSRGGGSRMPGFFWTRPRQCVAITRVMCRTDVLESIRM
jgi:hypothetical protein